MKEQMVFMIQIFEHVTYSHPIGLITNDNLTSTWGDGFISLLVFVFYLTLSLWLLFSVGAFS